MALEFLNASHDCLNSRARSLSPAMSLVDSRPVFAARCAAIGLSQQVVQDLVDKGWDTYATFAFCVPTLPGASEASEQSFVDNVITPILGDAAHVDAPKLRRLAFESYTMNAADLKRRVESSEGDAPKKLPALEIAHRLDEVRAVIAPLIVENQLEPSHALVNAVAQCVEEGRWRYFEWSRLTTRNQEVQGLAENAPLKAWKADRNGVVRESSADLDIETKVASDLDLQNALRRRGVAYHAAAAMSFGAHEKILARLFDEFWRPPPAGFLKVTMGQLCQTDREIHTRLAERTRTGLVPTVTGELPLDCHVEPVLNMPAVQWLLMPRPASRANADPSAGRPAEKRRRAGEVPPPPPPGPAKGRRAEKKASKPKGAGKAQKAPMPQKLRGGTPVDEDGNAICFSYNLGQCVDPNCSRVHVCCAVGCFSKTHTFLQHKH